MQSFPPYKWGTPDFDPSRPGAYHDDFYQYFVVPVVEFLSKRAKAPLSRDDISEVIELVRPYYTKPGFPILEEGIPHMLSQYPDKSRDELVEDVEASLSSYFENLKEQALGSLMKIQSAGKF